MPTIAWSGNDHSAASEPPIFEVIDGLVDVIERIFGLVHLHQTIRIQLHQFDEFRVVADETAADLYFVDNQVHGEMIEPSAT